MEGLCKLWLCWGEVLMSGEQSLVLKYESQGSTLGIDKKLLLGDQVLD